jgi:hypothetical protein
MDGSHHGWFGGRRPKCVLMGYIDDATGRIFCRFYEYKGTIPAMDSFKRYIREHSIPLSVYFDKHTTYKSTAEPSIEDELNGTEPLSEFGRALTELGVKLIHAHSPRAKGRVERMFNTLRDRLVKEMTLAHDGRLYQVQEPVKSKKVLVHERVNGKMLMTHNHISLKFKEITARPEKQQKPFRKLRQRGKDICRQLITHGGNSILRCFTSRPIGLKSCLRLHCENQTFSFCLDILKVYA